MADSFSTTETDWQGVDDDPTAGSNNLVKSGGVFDDAVAPFSVITMQTFEGGAYKNENDKVVFAALATSFKYLHIDNIQCFKRITVSNTHSYGVYKTFVTDSNDNILETYEMSERVTYNIDVTTLSASAQKLYVSSIDQVPNVTAVGNKVALMTEYKDYVDGEDFSALFRQGFYTIDNETNKAVWADHTGFKCYCIENLSNYAKVYYDGRVRGGAHQIITDANDNVLWSSQDNSLTSILVSDYPGAAKFYFSNEKTVREEILTDMAADEAQYAIHLLEKGAKLSSYYQDKNVYYRVTDYKSGEIIDTNYNGEAYLVKSTATDYILNSYLVEEKYGESYYETEEIPYQLIDIYIAENMTKNDRFSVVSKIVGWGFKLQYAIIFIMLGALIGLITLLCFLYFDLSIS
jgi:hypothetical protein